MTASFPSPQIVEADEAHTKVKRRFVESFDRVIDCVGSILWLLLRGAGTPPSRVSCVQGVAVCHRVTLIPLPLSLSLLLCPYHRHTNYSRKVMLPHHVSKLKTMQLPIPDLAPMEDRIHTELPAVEVLFCTCPSLLCLTLLEVDYNIGVFVCAPNRGVCGTQIIPYRRIGRTCSSRA